MKLNSEKSLSESLSIVEEVYTGLIPSVPFEYEFADQEYAKKFETEERLGKLSSVFSFLAIFISCLGLFGMASFMAEQRTKEIGIRKVLGATIFNLWKMLSAEFIALVVLSCIIAAPIAYYVLSSWLENYQYRTELSWWFFAVAGLGAMIITLLTVSFQAIRTARMNPVNSLRSE